MTMYRALCPPTCLRAISGVARRALLTAGTSIGFSLAAHPAGAQSDAARMRPQERDLLVRADSTDLTPLTPDAMPADGFPMMAFPFDPVAKLVRDGSRLNKILVQRLDRSGLNEPTAQRAAEGVVAYSAICPHTGCEVVSWHADTQFLECPCHNSLYDPKAGARVVSGPTPRSLAALPLRIANGNLEVAHQFIGRLGMQQM
jgi:rieske iron-sulfur protein